MGSAKNTKTDINQMNSSVSWSNLPMDILISIAKRIDAHFDVLHFRAVCQSWRSSMPAPKPLSPSLPMQLRFLTDVPINPLATFIVQRKSVFRLEPAPLENSTPNNNGWLIKVQEESNGGKKLVINPFSRFPIKNLPATFPKKLNLLNFRISLITTAFSIERCYYDYYDSNEDEYEDEVECDPYFPYYDDDDTDSISSIEEIPIAYKAALTSSSSPGSHSNNGIFTMIGGEFYSMGVHDDQWTPMDCTDTYRDIINFKGDIYAVLRSGIGSKNDISKRVSTHLILPPRSFCGERYFVESCGNLFLVSRDYTICSNKIYYDNDSKCFFKKEGATNIPFKFEVFKMNTVGPTATVYRWDEVSDLGDRIFCVSRDCSFSVAAQDFAGCRGNCIYFVDELSEGYYYYEDGDLVDNAKIFVFNLEDGSAGPLTSFPDFPNIFWPPPMWLVSNPAAAGE